MGEDKREALRNRMFYLLNDEEEELKEKKRRELQLKREEEARRRRKITVKTIIDLTEKYKDYDVNVDTCKKIITFLSENNINNEQLADNNLSLNIVPIAIIITNNIASIIIYLIKFLKNFAFLDLSIITKSIIDAKKFIITNTEL